MAKRTMGMATEAKNWVNKSSLSDWKKDALISFIQHYPHLMFYKKARPDADPAWLRELGEVFLGVYSEELLWWYQFSHFDHSEYDDSRFQESFYGNQSFARDIGEFEEIMMEGTPLLIVACVLETMESVLAVKADDSGDLGVYDFSYMDIRRDEDAAGKGTIDPGLARLAFPSYCEMLSRVKAIRFSDDTVVEAEV
ncbi:hypothetical protein D3C75_556010 [compost metagenome]